nr:asparagine synthase (glutamine-hydrolyzing) [uncultured Draconibacterium sp.]
MCGILGIHQKNSNNTKLMDEMLNLIQHRGPDGATQVTHNNFTLGHRRLAIIDLNTGDQPIYNEDNSICIVFNGEIYNFKELRQELQAKGHIFRTQTDTEVILHGFEEYSTAFFSRMNGIFTFALLDIVNNTLFLARDHFGIKPLHYYHNDALLVFGSEQKSILLHPQVPRELNKQALHLQLNLRYTQGDETLFKHIKRLPPAHYLKFSEGKIEIKQFWELKYNNVNQYIKENEAIDGMHFYMKQAVERQLVSDVPVGVYLSGGLDSSTIVQKMHELGVEQINTFTLGFNEPTDEFTDAEQIAKYFGTNHHTLSLQMNPMEKFPEVIWHAEEPKINLLQGFNMSKFVSNHVKVVLGGLGGDELFAGYDIHKFTNPFNAAHAHMPLWMQKVALWKSRIIFKLQNASGKLPIDEYRRGVQMLLALGNVEKFYLIMRNTWDYDEPFYQNIYAGKYQGQALHLNKVHQYFDSLFEKANTLKALEQVLFVEMQSKMINDYLLVEDRMSMSNSVEERVPFLDLDLVNFANSIPVHLKIKQNQTKYLFRKAMENHLPPKIITKKKWGFTVNPYLQFKKDLKEVAQNILTKEFVEQQGIFNYQYIEKIINYKPYPKLRWHYNYIWVALGIAIWQKMFIETDNFKKREFMLEEYFNR